MRIGFRMKLEPGREAEYTHRHNPIWRELERTLLEHGVQTYTIFLDRQTNDLFAYAEIDSIERWRAIADTDVCRRWWAYMADLMPTNPDSSPWSRELAAVRRRAAARVSPGRIARRERVTPASG